MPESEGCNLTLPEYLSVSFDLNASEEPYCECESDDWWASGLPGYPTQTGMPFLMKNIYGVHECAISLPPNGQTMGGSTYWTTAIGNNGVGNSCEVGGELFVCVYCVSGHPTHPDGYFGTVGIQFGQLQPAWGAEVNAIRHVKLGEVDGSDFSFDGLNGAATDTWTNSDPPWNGNVACEYENIIFTVSSDVQEPGGEEGG